MVPKDPANLPSPGAGRETSPEPAERQAPRFGRWAAVALTASMLLAPMPAAAEGEPAPPFEDETWRIEITHNADYWLNVRYVVFGPDWSYEEQGYSGAHVTGHSGCGDVYAPMLLNTAFAAEGEHEIIVYFGGYCTHVGDSGEETKYDRFPNGTQISIDATLERFLPGSNAASEMVTASGTVVVTSDAPLPVSLGSIAVSGVELQADTTVATRSSSTTIAPEHAAAGAADEETADTDAAGVSEETTADGEGGGLIGIILTIALVLGVGAVILLVKKLLGHGTAPLSQEANQRAIRESVQAAQKSAQADSAWFREQATHLIEPGQVVWVVNPGIAKQVKAEGKDVPPGMDARLPLSIEPMRGDPNFPEEEGPFIPAMVRDGVTVVHDPDHPDIAVLRTGAQIGISPDQLTPLPSSEFTPTHELTGARHIEGRGVDKVFAYQPGTPVQVVTTEGDRTLVRVDAETEVWVPRSNVGAATAHIDPPHPPPSASGPAPPPPPRPPSG